MLSYKEMRAALKASPEHVKLKHFTTGFYETFCKAWQTKDWAEVYTTDFYNLEGFGYCVFLEVFNASLPRWCLTFTKMDAGYPIRIAEREIREDTEEAARSAGMDMMERFGADYLDVVQVA